MTQNGQDMDKDGQEIDMKQTEGGHKKDRKWIGAGQEFDMRWTGD